jgi:pimeloyl-ACP methyl ester carboxylesterase
MGGSDDFFDLFEYYYDVRDVMREAGFDVYATVVDPLAPSDRRARQLASQLSVIMEATGARKINLIGHSQGGVDGRALISTLGWGDRVASLTTIATPHRGTPLVDVIEGTLPDDALTEGLVDAVGDIYGTLLGRGNQELPAALRELGVEGMTEIFNPTHPDDSRVAYYSWTGHTCALTETACQAAWSGEVVDPFLAPAYRALQLLGEEASDGLVPVSSGQWGEFLGELPADHLDEVGMLFDDDNQVFDHRAFFVAEGDRLFSAGF